MAAAAVAAAAWAGALLAPALEGDRAGLPARLAAALADPLAVRPTGQAARARQPEGMQPACPSGLRRWARQAGTSKVFA